MSEEQGPIIGIILDESGLVEAVVTNSSIADGIPVVVIDKATDGIPDGDLDTLECEDGTEQVMTYRVGGVFETQFDMSGL